MVAWRDIPGNPGVFDELVRLLASGGAVTFVGAGASAGLYPLWPQLIEILADAAVRAGRADEAAKDVWCQRMDALQAARQIRKRLGNGTFAELVREVFGPKAGADGKRYTPLHSALARMGFSAFVTTNYDPALTFACQEHRPGLLVRDFDWRHDRVALWLQGRPARDGELAILHAHGQYDASDSVVLDAEDYRRAYGDDRYRSLFEQLWTRERLVFVGYSLREPWLRIIADEALSRAGAREVSTRRHVAVLGLPEGDVATTDLHREEIEETYHLRALFYPVGPRSDHSALGALLEELVAATTTPVPPPPPPPDPLAVWFRQVADEHRRLGDGFERPKELHLLEQAWVQVKVRSAFEDEVAAREHLADAKHTLLGRPATLDEVLELPAGEPAWNTGRWLLEGPPGSGKTTLLRHLAARLARRASADRVPVFASLPRLVDAGQELLHHVTDGLALAGADQVRGALAAAGREGRLLILLDGFDEVRRERRASVRRLLDHLARDDTWSSCPVVVSSRPIGRSDALDELPRLDLLPLDEERRLEFLEKWMRHAGRDDWQTEAASAMAHFRGSRGLRDLSGIPLYLTLLAVLWEQGVRPPGQLAALYDEIFELLLGGRHKPEPRPMPIQDDVREALGHLAAGMTEDDLWAEPVKRLERRLRSLDDVCHRLVVVDEWKHDLFVFLRDVHERTQILGPHDGGHGDWRYWHRTFREALTAERLLAQHGEAGSEALIEWARQLEEGGESRWAEPLALLAGRLDDADDLVLRLGKANPKLAVRAAAFAQGLKPETVHAILQLTEDLNERAQVFEGIPDQLGDADACLALVEQLREGNRNGFDLFWLWWIVEEVERRWRPGNRARELLDRFFDHIPPPEDPEPLWSFESPLDGRVELWREVPAGEIWVGSPEDEKGRDSDEGPRHRVEIVQPYWLGAVPVTNAQYAAFDPGKPFYNWSGLGEDKLPSHPRVKVTWYEAVSFCRWLATLPGFAGTDPRLPVEEEWEVACRAGTSSRFWRGDNDEDLRKVGWFDGNADGRTHRVGRKPANDLGLHDIHGNVWEWTASPWDSERYKGRPKDAAHRIDPAVSAADLAAPPRVRRVVRGGSCLNGAQNCRSAYRDFGDPRVEFGDQGFRVLLSSAPSRP